MTSENMCDPICIARPAIERASRPVPHPTRPHDGLRARLATPAPCTRRAGRHSCHGCGTARPAREGEPHSGAPVLVAHDTGYAAEDLHLARHRSQPESSPSSRAGDLHIRLEELGGILCRDADTRVLHLEQDLVLLPLGWLTRDGRRAKPCVAPPARRGPQRNVPFARELDRIAHQVEQHVYQPVRISGDFQRPASLQTNVPDGLHGTRAAGAH
mmetsp:Transcript_17637/g.57750  ORF Transcript_17637/g.57750 Transcript_17637/m.57750 type:complete len:214 (-) Transcript_17637:293-934(-)